MPPVDPRSDLTEMLRVPVRSLMGLNARFAHDARGASGMIFAASLPFVIGFGWLSAETGMWYTIKRQLRLPPMLRQSPAPTR